MRRHRAEDPAEEDKACKFKEEYMVKKPHRHLCTAKNCSNQLSHIYLDFDDCKLRLCQNHLQKIEAASNKGWELQYLNGNARISPKKENVDLLKKLETDYSQTTKRWLDTVDDRTMFVEGLLSDYQEFMFKAEIAVRETIIRIIEELQKLLDTPDIRITQALCPDLDDYPTVYQKDLEVLLSYQVAGATIEQNIKGLVTTLDSMQNKGGDGQMKQSDLSAKINSIEEYCAVFDEKLARCPVLERNVEAVQRAANDNKPLLSMYKSSEFWEDKIIYFISKYSADAVLKTQTEPPAEPIAPVLEANNPDVADPAQADGQPIQAQPDDQQPPADDQQPPADPVPPPNAEDANMIEASPIEPEDTTDQQFQVVAHLIQKSHKWLQLQILNAYRVGEMCEQPPAKNDEINWPDIDLFEEVKKAIEKNLNGPFEWVGSAAAEQLIKEGFSMSELSNLVDTKQVSKVELVNFLTLAKNPNNLLETLLSSQDSRKIILKSMAKIQKNARKSKQRPTPKTTPAGVMSD